VYVSALAFRVLDAGPRKDLDGVVGAKMMKQFPVEVGEAPPTPAYTWTDRISTDEGVIEAATGFSVGDRVCITVARGRVTGTQYVLGLSGDACSRPASVADA
jgi:hypothetical protein